MMISTKGRYGLRAILDLVLNTNQTTQVSLISIAERQNISKSYLEQVFSALKKSGIVKSVKGAQGGYVLAKEASQITIGEILRALEGDLTVVSDNNLDEQNQIEIFMKSRIWDKIDEQIKTLVDGMTLEDMIRDYKNDFDEIMYYI